MGKIITEFEIPKGLKYTKLHEWIKIDGNVLTLGITDFAQYQIKNINSVLDPMRGEGSIPIGTELEALSEQEHRLTIVKEGKTSTGYIPRKTIALINCSKGDFFAYSPIRGKILAANESLSTFDGGAIINKDPYGENSWLVKIEIIDPAPLEKLLDAEGYRKFIRGE